jgi:hypothetical protein
MFRLPSGAIISSSSNNNNNNNNNNIQTHNNAVYILECCCSVRMATEGSRNMWGAFVIQILVQLFGNKVVYKYISFTAIIINVGQLHSVNIVQEHVSK